MRFSLLSAVALMVMGTGISHADGNTVANSLLGTWRVASVNPDQRATISVDTKVNDPRYVGRTLELGKDAVQGELDGSIQCRQPAFTPQPAMALDAAIQKTSGEHNTEPKKPVAQDYGLKIPGNQQITPYLFACQSGNVGPDGVVMKNWVAPLSPDSLIMNWDDNSYIVLQRVTAGEKVAPSFSCSAKVNAVEQTICDSNDLASWDRSVASAFKVRLFEQQSTDPKDTQTVARIKSEQREWIAKRNQCQADAACLKKSMQERVETLVDQMQ